jgi:hypothetical protein
MGIGSTGIYLYAVHYACDDGIKQDPIKCVSSSLSVIRMLEVRTPVVMKQ